MFDAGDRLKNGRYKIIKELGHGGFGITYLADDDIKKQQVVIKTLNDGEIRPKDWKKFRDDFSQEILNLARCDSHPHIVSVLDTFNEGDLPCMVMEYIEGKTLAELVTDKGILSETEALSYITKIGDALSFIHHDKESLQLLHRDVKPSNIMIDKQGKPVLIDFGTARQFNPDGNNQHTRFCSKGYTPIEVIESENRVNEVGYCTDIYGLAGTLYYCLTGKDPLDVSERLDHHRIDTLESPKKLNTNISDRLNNAILKGLAIETENRPNTIKEWLSMLPQLDPSNQKTQPILSDNGQEITIPLDKSNLNNQRNSLLWGLGIISAILFVILLSMGIGFLVVLSQKPNPTPIPDPTLIPTPIPSPEPPISQTCIENGKLCIPNTIHWSLKTNPDQEILGVIELADLTLSDTSKVSKGYPPKISIAKMTSDPNQPINDLFFEQQKAIQNQTRYPQSMILDIKDQGVDIDSNPAYVISYKFKDDQTMVQSLRYGIKTTDAVYLITFQAEEQDYSMIEAEAETIIKSITFR